MNHIHQSTTTPVRLRLASLTPPVADTLLTIQFNCPLRSPSMCISAIRHRSPELTSITYGMSSVNIHAPLKKHVTHLFPFISHRATYPKLTNPRTTIEADHIINNCLANVQRQFHLKYWWLNPWTVEPIFHLQEVLIPLNLGLTSFWKTSLRIALCYFSRHVKTCASRIHEGLWSLALPTLSFIYRCHLFLHQCEICFIPATSSLFQSFLWTFCSTWHRHEFPFAEIWIPWWRRQVSDWRSFPWTQSSP